MDPRRHHQSDLESAGGGEIPGAERADDLESGGSVDASGSSYEQPTQTSVIASSLMSSDGTHLRAAGGSETSLNSTDAQDAGMDDSSLQNEDDLDEEARIRRDLDRRPSFRRIFDDLSHVKDAGDSDVHAIAKSEGCMVTQRGLGVQVTLQQPIVDPNIASGVQGLQPFHVTQVGLPTNQAGMIYHQSPQQVRVPVSATQQMAATQFVTGMPSQYARVNALGSPQAMVLNTGMGPNAQQLAEESARKRELRLMKNREAAKECRRKKKDYVKCLENRVAVLEAQNKTLIDELKALKDLYCHKSE
ncbi:cAMP-responsive element modulator-like [Corticium candelabrum]|uniref:cAMP-responsive element modulator-like n=1 Tax=Corticium candelabrum TaxID=121492 RepID=UPI002E256B07|nr:cAMP-responsive element modulator-like [Corticium candelabrum]